MNMSADDRGFGLTDIIHIISLASDRPGASFANSANHIYSTSNRDGSDPRLDKESLQTAIESSRGLLIVIVEEWYGLLDSALQATFTTFPDHLLGNFFDQRRPDHNFSIPFFDSDKGILSFTTHHLVSDLTQYAAYGEERLQDQTRSIYLTAWICSKGALALDPDRPVAFILGKGQGVAASYFYKKLYRHYASDDCRRLLRLANYTPGLYMDLFYVFVLDACDGTLTAARQKLVNMEHNSYARVLPVLHRTRELHKAIAHLINVGEHLALHLAAMQRLNTIILLSNDDQLEALQRLEGCRSRLSSHELSCSIIKEQTQNLLNLEFNVESVLENQALTRLTVLAFIFVPLSLVASIFGMTQFSVSSRYYPAAAIPITLLTIVVAASAGKLVTLWENSSEVLFTGRRGRKNNYRNEYAEIGRSEHDMDVLPSRNPPGIGNLRSTAVLANRPLVAYVPSSLKVALSAKLGRHSNSRKEPSGAVISERQQVAYVPQPSGYGRPVWNDLEVVNESSEDILSRRQPVAYVHPWSGPGIVGANDFVDYYAHDVSEEVMSARQQVAYVHEVAELAPSPLPRTRDPGYSARR